MIREREGPMEESTEKRVWQRVRGEPDRAEAVRRCLADQGRLAGAYRQLARRGGKFRRLWERKLEQIDSLRGMLRVMTGQGAAFPQTEPGPVDLRRCFETEQRTLGELQRLCRDEELGPVFEVLRERQKGQVRLLLEILGTM